MLRYSLLNSIKKNKTLQTIYCNKEFLIVVIGWYNIAVIGWYNIHLPVIGWLGQPRLGCRSADQSAQAGQRWYMHQLEQPRK